jgi:hypothetical protein
MAVASRALPCFQDAAEEPGRADGCACAAGDVSRPDDCDEAQFSWRLSGSASETARTRKKVPAVLYARPVALANPPCGPPSRRAAGICRQFSPRHRDGAQGSRCFRRCLLCRRASRPAALPPGLPARRVSAERRRFRRPVPRHHARREGPGGIRRTPAVVGVQPRRGPSARGVHGRSASGSPWKMCDLRLFVRRRRRPARLIPCLGCECGPEPCRPGWACQSNIGAIGIISIERQLSA